MDRRSFLRGVAAAMAGGAGGCVSNGRVVLQKQETVMIPPGRGEIVEITDVDGSGAISYTVRADRRFDVFYFTSSDQYEYYRRYMNGQKVERPPSGESDLTRAAVYDEDDEKYVVRVPEEGGRRSITVEDTHYFVVDYSNYGMGVPVEKEARPLRAFVSLTVIDQQFPI